MNIKEIVARYEAATPGPWHVERAYDCKSRVEWLDVMGPEGEALIGCDETRSSSRVIRNADNDARFIAEARADVPALVKYAEQVTAELIAAHDALRAIAAILHLAPETESDPVLVVSGVAGHYGVPMMNRQCAAVDYPSRRPELPSTLPAFIHFARSDPSTTFVVRGLAKLQPMELADGSGAGWWLAYLVCGHKIATDVQRTAYQCPQCGVAK